MRLFQFFFLKQKTAIEMSISDWSSDVCSSDLVLGNGDIWEASDALDMIEQTGCDGVVVGRGCLGRPWLFRDLADAFAGRPVQPPPKLGEVCEVMRDHARRLLDWIDPATAGVPGLTSFRKHASWYLTGYPAGGRLRHEIALVRPLRS